MLQGENSAVLLTFIKLPFVIKIFVLSIFEWPFYTGVTVSVLTYIADAQNKDVFLAPSTYPAFTYYRCILTNGVFR